MNAVTQRLQRSFLLYPAVYFGIHVFVGLINLVIINVSFMVINIRPVIPGMRRIDVVPVIFHRLFLMIAQLIAVHITAA